MVPPPDPVLQRLTPEHRDTEQSEPFLNNTVRRVRREVSLTSSNNMAVGPRNRTSVSRRGTREAESRPERI